MPRNKKKKDDMEEVLAVKEKQLQLAMSQRDAYHRQLDRTERRLQIEINKRKCECGKELISYCAFCDGL